MTDLQKEQIKTLRLQGIGYVKIGEMLGISDNTVRSFCRRNGLGDAAKNHGCLQALRKTDKNHPQAETSEVLFGCLPDCLVEQPPRLRGSESGLCVHLLPLW